MSKLKTLNIAYLCCAIGSCKLMDTQRVFVYWIAVSKPRNSFFFFFYEVCYREHEEGRGGVQKTFVMRQYTGEEDTAGVCDLLPTEASAP